MSKIGLSAAISTVALLGLPGTSPAQHGGRESGPGGYSHGGYQQRYGGNGGYGRGSYGGYGWGYYGPGFGWYIGTGPGYGYRYPYYGGYGSPYDWGYYDNPPSYSYVAPSYNDQPSYGYAGDQDPNAALLEVVVPENAQLWFAGAPTVQTGPVRHFVSPALPPGQTFTYEIRARWTDASGRSIDRIKQVKVKAGARIGVDFNS